MGRAVQQRKLRVDEVHALDLTLLGKKGFFRATPEAISSSRWTHRGEMFEVFLKLLRDESGTPRIVVMVHRDPGTHCLGGYAVELDSTPCFYGGRRLWFRCPAITQDGPCGRRCRILYRPRGASRFGCRGCHRLSYQSRQHSRDRWFEFWRAFDVLRAELHRPCFGEASARHGGVRLRLFRRAASVIERHELDRQRYMGKGLGTAPAELAPASDE